MRVRAAIAVAVALACGPAAAQTNTVFIRGWGASSCESWTAERQKPSPNAVAAMTSWVFGFLGAYNLYSYRGTANGIDEMVNNADIVDWLDRFCKEQPGTNLSQAAATLVKLLGKPR